MSRIRTETSLTRIKEAVSPVTTIYWNPVTNDGILRFNVEDIVIENDEILGLTPNTQLKRNASGAAIIDRSIAELMPRNVEIPTGPDTSITVPLMLVMGAIKALFNEVYTEQLNLQDNPPRPPITPMPPHIDPVTRRPRRPGSEPDE